MIGEAGESGRTGEWERSSSREEGRGGRGAKGKTVGKWGKREYGEEEAGEVMKEEL